MTDVPALTKQLEAGLGCTAGAAIWAAENRHALLLQIADQNKVDRALDARVPALTITESDKGLEIDVLTSAGLKHKVLQMGTTQQLPVCDGGVLDKDFESLRVNDATVADGRIAFDATSKDSPFKRGDIGAGTEQFNTPAQKLVFQKLSKEASNDEKVEAARTYIERTMPHASQAAVEQALTRFLSPPISKSMPLGISEVAKNGPADLAGLRAGDVITAINGTSVSGKTYEETAPTITGAPGTPVRLTIERNEHGKIVQLEKQLGRVDANPSSMVDVNASNFADEVSHSSVPVFIDVKADWCLPCRQMAPILEELKKEYAGRVKFVRIDIDNSPGLVKVSDADGDLVLPTMAFYNPAQKDAPAALGLHDKAGLTKFIDNQLAHLGN